MTDQTQGQAEALLRACAAQLGFAATGRKIGVSRTLVSLYVSGKYRSDPAPLLAKAMAALGGISCPARGGERVDFRTCAAAAVRSLPTHSPAAARAWGACRACVHHPKKETSK
jgi:hypothetical protein